MTQRENGVAPVWKATGDGDYAIPDGWQCIGVHVGVAGDVGFTSGGVAITPTLAAGQHPAKIDSFQASGTTATDIYALLVK